MRAFVENTVAETMGGAAWLGVGVVAVAVLYPPFRRQIVDWGREIGEEFQGVWHDSRSRAGLLSGAAAVAAAGATVAAGAAIAAPEAAAPAAAAATLPAAAVAIPMALEGISRAADAKDAVERLLKHDDDEPGDVH